MKRGDLKIIKTAEDNMIEGIEFHLYGTALSGENIDERTKTNAQGIAEFKNGEISEEDFYREWLEGVWIFIDSNYNEIKRMADKKSESATLLYPKRGDR